MREAPQTQTGVMARGQGMLEKITGYSGKETKACKGRDQGGLGGTAWGNRRISE